MQAFREEKAEAERRMRERPAPSTAPTEPQTQHVVRVDHEPSVAPSAPEKVPAYSPVPTVSEALRSIVDVAD